MAFTKQGTKKQIEQAVQQAVPPGESVEVSVFCMTGNHPVVVLSFMGAFGIFGAAGGLLGALFSQLLTRYCFVAVTTTSLVTGKASWTGRPREITSVEPLGDVRISDVRRGIIFHSLRCQRPGEAAVTRLNVHRSWRREFGQLVAALQATADAA